MAKGKKADGAVPAPASVKSAAVKKTSAGAKKAAAPSVTAVEVVAAAAAAPPAHDAIARRAYEIFCERGGTAFDNWIEAERQLRG